MKLREFANEFTSINQEFKRASDAFVKTSTWRPFKQARHLKEMRAATLKMEMLKERLALNYVHKVVSK